jgi:periplasmic divalent cation tolerance protein
LNDCLLVITTLPDQTTAASLADRLVRDRLAACVNIGAAVTSVYLWEGRQQHDSEVMLTIKTTASRYPALQDAIVAAHPYELPEVIAVPITAGLPQYLAWIETCTSD